MRDDTGRLLPRRLLLRLLPSGRLLPRRLLAGRLLGFGRVWRCGLWFWVSCALWNL